MTDWDYTVVAEGRKGQIIEYEPDELYTPDENNQLVTLLMGDSRPPEKIIHLPPCRILRIEKTQTTA